MGSNDPLENPLFIQKREYHAVKDENRTNTGPKTDTAPTSTGLARTDATNSQKQTPTNNKTPRTARTSQAATGSFLSIPFYSSTRMIFAPRFRSFSTKCS